MGSYQLDIISRLGIKSSIHSPLRPGRMQPVQALRMQPQSLCVHMCSSPDMSTRPCFFGVFLPHWLLNPFWLLFCTGPWVLSKMIRWQQTIYDRMSQGLSDFAHHLVVGLCASSHLTREEGNFFDEDWARYWHMGIAIVFGFSGVHVLSRFLATQTVLAWAPSHELGFQSVRLWLVAHTTFATIAPVNYVDSHHCRLEIL